MDHQLIIDHIEIQISFKKIKNIHLRVRATDGAVTVSAPRRMSLDAIQAFVQSKITWIHKHRGRLRSQARVAPKQFVDGELHDYWGRQYPLRIVSIARSSKVIFHESSIDLYVRPQSTPLQRQMVLMRGYAEQLKAALPELIEKYEALMGVKVSGFALRNMKTRWGSCNIRTAKICFNVALVEKPMACLEYVVVHELVHLLEPSHNKRFVGFMDRYLPDWQERKRVLNGVLVATA